MQTTGQTARLDWKSKAREQTGKKKKDCVQERNQVLLLERIAFHRNKNFRERSLEYFVFQVVTWEVSNGIEITDSEREYRYF